MSLDLKNIVVNLAWNSVLRGSLQITLILPLFFLLRFESLTLVQIIPVELLSEEQRDATYVVESEAEKAVEEVCDDDQAEPAKSTETSLQPLNYKELYLSKNNF